MLFSITRIAGVVALSVMAARSAHAADNFVYGSVNERAPFELGYGRVFSDNLDLRLGLGVGGTHGYDHTINGSDYRVKPNDSKVVDVMADWYWLPEYGLRATAGLTYNTNAGQTLASQLDGNGNYRINGNAYAPGAVGQYNSAVSYHKLAPYLGLGWDYGRPEQSGWRFTSEVGVQALSRDTVSVNASGAVGNMVLSQDLAAQKQHINNDFGGTQWRLTVGLGASYSF